MHNGNPVIDEIYAGFQDKDRVESLLNALGYRPATVNQLRSGYVRIMGYSGGCTDSQIKELILQSKKVTPQTIKELVQRPEAEEKYKRTHTRTVIGSFVLFALFVLLWFWFSHAIGL
jgi:hypothetical protein